MKIIKNESGIAIILALIMLLVMSILGLTVAFMSNINFQSMSNFKRGQESFLAAESCINIARNKLETVGIESLYFELQTNRDVNDPIPTTITNADIIPDIVIYKPLKDSVLTDPDDWTGPFCRSGPRLVDPNDGFPKFITQPPTAKVTGRPLKNTSLPSGSSGGVSLVPVVFTVTGKDSGDEDKTDRNNLINTGTEVAVGFETFVPGGATNIYSGQ
ncbi:MAG: pilus assembly PilX N-terminal domain-containing protein [Thermodesulfobacteriota bacterium]